VLHTQYRTACAIHMKHSTERYSTTHYSTALRANFVQWTVGQAQQTNTDAQRLHHNAEQHDTTMQRSTTHIGSTDGFNTIRNAMRHSALQQGGVQYSTVLYIQ